MYFDGSAKDNFYLKLEYTDASGDKNMILLHKQQQSKANGFSLQTKIIKFRQTLQIYGFISKQPKQQIISILMRSSVQLQEQ